MVKHGGLTVLSRNACERGILTWMESFFIRIFESLIFEAFVDLRANFSFLSGFDHLKIRFLSVFYHRTENFTSNPNLDKKTNLYVIKSG